MKRRTRQVAVGGAGGRAKVSHSHDYKEAFEKMFPKLVQDLIREGLNDPEISDGMKHLRKVCWLRPHGSFCLILHVIFIFMQVLNYNVPGGTLCGTWGLAIPTLGGHLVVDSKSLTPRLMCI